VLSARGRRIGEEWPSAARAGIDSVEAIMPGDEDVVYGEEMSAGSCIDIFLYRKSMLYISLQCFRRRRALEATSPLNFMPRVPLISGLTKWCVVTGLIQCSQLSRGVRV
jgi:hypothetical protein